jgi:hypothetical protein
MTTFRYAGMLNIQIKFILKINLKIWKSSFLQKFFNKNFFFLIFFILKYEILKANLMLIPNI